MRVDHRVVLHLSLWAGESLESTIVLLWTPLCITCVSSMWTSGGCTETNFWCSHPSRANFLHFHAILRKIWLNNRPPLLRVGAPSWEILDPSLWANCKSRSTKLRSVCHIPFRANPSPPPTSSSTPPPTHTFGSEMTHHMKVPLVLILFIRS